MHAALARLSARYGPVFSLRLGSRDAVVLSPAEHAGRATEPPALPLAAAHLLRRHHTLPTCGYGPHWRNLRRVATVQLLSAHRVSCSMSPARHLRRGAHDGAQDVPRRCGHPAQRRRDGKVEQWN
jgi:hypothetical protein